MNKIAQIDSLKKMNALSDPRRKEILDLLMQQPMTISQISRILGGYPAGSRHHVLKLKEAGLVVLSGTRTSDGYTEKYYRAVADAFFLQRMILPSTQEDGLVFMGSHDLALEILITELEDRFPGFSLINLPIGSLDGLIALRQGIAHLSGCHIFDADTNEFNTPLIKRFFPDQDVQTITLAKREQGLLLPPGNPKQITKFEDIGRADISIINRNPGSGTRIWFDEKLESIGLRPMQVNGYTQEVNSHTVVAETIKDGIADTGIGLIAAATHAGLDFIPLFDEQYDLVLSSEIREINYYYPMMDFLHSTEFRKLLDSLAGYNSINTGQSSTY